MKTPVIMTLNSITFIIMIISITRFIINRFSALVLVLPSNINKYEMGAIFKGTAGSFQVSFIIESTIQKVYNLS